jgi:hypothetical protein
MFKDLEHYDMTTFTPRFLAEVREKRKLADVAEEYDCEGASSVTVPIFSGGTSKPRIYGNMIPDFGGGIRKDVITTHDWDTAAYLDEFLIRKNNFNYESAVQRTLIPAAVSQRMDQTIIDALDSAVGVPEVAFSDDLLALFAEVQATLDEAEVEFPEEERNLILPTACKPDLFSNDKFTSNDYVQKELNSISKGKFGDIFGFNLIFMHRKTDGGLLYEPVDGGANLLWTCYATCKMAIGHALGYGANRSKEGTGGILHVKPLEERGSVFINAPHSDGAKVLLPQGVVRFQMKTKNYKK